MSEHTATQRAALRIDEVSIHEMPGIDEPFVVGPIGPGITVIHGPNASGKSRAAAAFQAAVWPEHADPGTHVRGQLTLGDTRWSVAARYGRSLWEQQGVPTGSAPVSYAPASQHDRYLLTLHDLLQADNRGFAELIQRESAGGFDFPAARSTLDVAAEPRTGANRERRELDAARATARSLRQGDHHLQERERARRSLEDQRDRAMSAETRIRLLEHALRHADAMVGRMEREAALQQFAPILEHLQGNEYAFVCEIQEQIDVARQQRDVARHDVDRLEQIIAQAGFGDGLPAEGTINRLNVLLLSMRQGSTDLRQITQDLAAQEALVIAIPDLAERGVDATQFAALNAGGLRSLADLGRRMHDVEGVEQTRIALERWLQTTVASDDPDPLRRAIGLLAHWLQVPASATDGSPLQRGALLLAATVIAALSVALAVISSPVWLAAIVIVPILGWVALRTPVSSSLQEQGRLEAAYAGLGVAPPSAWDVDSVISTLSALQDQFARALVEQEKRTRWADLADERRNLAATRDELAAERERQRDLLGVALQHADPDELRLLAAAVDRWVQAREAVVAQLARQATIQAEHDATLAEINQLFGQLGAGACTSIAGVETQLASVTSRIQVARSALVDLERLRSDVAHLSADIDRNRERVTKVFQAAGLDDGDLSGLRLLCEQTQPCRKARTALDQAATVVRTLAVELEADPALLGRERGDLELEIARLQMQAGQRDHLVEEIARLDQDLHQARHQTALEEAVHREAMALEALRVRRDQDVARAVRWEIAEVVAQATRDQNRPLVFHAARELFSQFTGGAWRLELDDGGHAVFYATETSTRRRCALVELSSGTRVQLLMAVRIAFLEVSEDGPRLPLILDETLGNSDDMRADAIIDATIEIARRGRQIIYFTAQGDEVHKWRSRLLGGEDVPDFTEIDLADIRGRAGAARSMASTWGANDIVQPVLSADTPHADARAVLKVPAVNLWADHDDEIDLWYCIQDMESLVSLRRVGVRTWGQYQNLRTFGARRQTLIDQAVHELAAHRMDIVQQTRRLWQQGRARPMTPGDLVRSGAVSERFIEPVNQLAERLNWQAEGVVRALRNREVSGFRQNAIQDLETYCQAQGLITGQEALSPETIRAHVWAALRDDSTDDSDALLAEIDAVFILLASPDPGSGTP